ncbi:MAG: PAS domain S-box protein [Demequinaceae bacterium]|nr:PAS domain S-box protein [Demequinaceae bacterium]
MPNPDRPLQKSPRRPKSAEAPFVHDDVECRVFRALADRAFFAKVFADSQGIIQYVNPHFAEMLGYRPEELVGQHISIAHTPEQMKDSQRIIESSIERGHSEPEENWYVRRDGTEFPLLVGCVTVRSPVDGEPFTAMSGVDISPILQARKDYQTLFDEMLDGFAHHEIICDDSGAPIDYRYLSVNSAWEDMVGLKADDVIGKTVLEVLPGVEKAWIDTFGAVAITGEPNRFKNYSAPLDKHFEVTAYCPAPGEFACLFTDITERVKAEQAYRTLFNEMLDAFSHFEVIFDDSGKAVDYRYLAVNPAWERAREQRAEDVVGKTLTEVSPDYDPAWIEMAGRVATTGEPIRTNIHYEGLDKYFEATVFRPAPGECAVILLDITDRKVYEDALRKGEHDLQRTQRLANVGSWTWDFATGKVTWTEVLFEVFGLEPAPTAPTFSEQEDLVTPSTYKALREAVAGTKETGIPYEVELEIPREDGTSRWLWARGEPVTDATGQITGLWGAAQDITERKMQEADKLRLEAQLSRAQRLESVGRFAGSVAHDFNNMLTVILGHVERDLPRIQHDNPVYADLMEIGQVAERSAALTRQLLAFASSQPASPRVIDLNKTIEAILVMMRRLIGEEINLTWNPGKDLSPVRIDPTQVDQILANLCVNARDAIDDVGDITIETKNVHFNAEFCAWHPDCREGDYVELSVTDNGSGMDLETQARLFEPFFTTKDQGQGTGLGLSTLYGIVQQNNGFVTVTSEPGVGTTFRINLPRQAAGSESSPEPTAEVTDEPGTETVLLVEDEPAILKMVSIMLGGRGYTVLTAATPSEAIRLAQNHSGSIDLLLTYVIMPEMNGAVLAERIRSLQPDLKCLFMSGYTANVLAPYGVLDDGAHFIAKPFHLKDLAAKVREVLDS